jgi:hypothetical protein
LQYEEDRLPLFAALRDLNRYLERRRTPLREPASRHLAEFLQKQLQEFFPAVHVPDNFFARALHEERCLVLLDGLDEIADHAQLARVVNSVAGLATHSESNRIVVASRPHAFNLTAGWWGPDVLGIDQGPIVLMIENHRSQRVWKRFMQAPEIQRGLMRAGFTNVVFVRPKLSAGPTTSEFTLSWTATAKGTYQVEYGPDLE